MSNAEVVRPDMLFTRNNDDGRAIDQPWQLLNPCPYCGAVPHDAPDGVHANGDPRWNFPHCFACGFRPQSVQAEGLERTRQEFAAFQAWQANQSQQALSPAPVTVQPSAFDPAAPAQQPQPQRSTADIIADIQTTQAQWQPPEQGAHSAAADSAVQAQATDATTQQGS